MKRTFKKDTILSWTAIQYHSTLLKFTCNPSNLGLAPHSKRTPSIFVGGMGTFETVLIDGQGLRVVNAAWKLQKCP